MNTPFFTFLGMLAAALLLVLSDCYDRVTNRYATRVEAEADRLFDRGWLPSFIPTSASDIRVSNDLDLNTSEGSFLFMPSEAVGFTAKLTRLDASALWDQQQRPFLERGFTAHHHAEAGSEWMFLVSAATGRCDYFMRPIQCEKP